MALCCEAFYVKQTNNAKQNKRNAEPALKGWFSGFGKRSARESHGRFWQHCPAFSIVTHEIIPA
jgi:hypothetical protein